MSKRRDVAWDNRRFRKNIRVLTKAQGDRIVAPLLCGPGVDAPTLPQPPLCQLPAVEEIWQKELSPGPYDD